MHRLFQLFSFLLLSLVLPVSGQEEKSEAEKYEESAESIEVDLRNSLEELATLRKSIAKEKPALSRETNEIAATLREKRRQADIARTRQDAVETQFVKTEADMEAWEEERSYIEGLLFDFRKNFEAANSLAENATIRQELNDPSLAGQLALLDRTLIKLESSGSITTVPGEALGEDGTLHQGEFAEAGPVSWFLSKDRTTAGIVTSDSALRSRVLEGTADSKSIELLLNGRATLATFDPTLGSAVALEETDTSLIGQIKDGGVWIYPILLLAAIALIAALAKWIQLLRIREIRPGAVQRAVSAVNAGKREEAEAIAAEIRHPAGTVLIRGVELAGKVSKEDLEEALYEVHLAAQPPLQRGLPLIAIAAATAPLLGLLGTVTGMIETFRLINIFGTGDARSLASGISEALVTTEFGLVVAIPALILHALLSRKTQGIRNTMEMTSLAFLNGIETKAQAPAESKSNESPTESQSKPRRVTSA